MEKAIKNYMFERAQTKIKIVERYELSELYNPEKLFLLYKDSFLLDLKKEVMWNIVWCRPVNGSLTIILLR